MDRFYRWLEVSAPALGNLPPLVVAAFGAMALIMLGGALLRAAPRLSRAMRVSGNLVLLGVFVLAAMRFVRMDPAFDTFANSIAMPAQTVSGGETRVPLSADGHYWIEANVNGARQRFMIDTGATLTAISPATADKAGIEPDPLRLPVVMRTANGDAEAQLAKIAELRFGSIVARDMDVVVTGPSGGVNVLGMNFLSRLKGWRVENGVLILSPRNPQPPAG